ncbi:LexA family protein [Turicibacter sanguinis]|uniref:LexA family protein n=1 Tax=Turicibacter sanguinis TaxID=154288 RepID=UPI0021D5076E|nr:XRE family transcriptional regulator [Turicibacter sanguinis]MCU7195873.1 XRE family transcriptional regulator [Turicibacter sanguinis]
MFGKNLKYLRLRDNISQDELAHELGYKSYTTIQKWEMGLSEPNMGVVNKLANKWHLSLDELVNVDLEAKRYNSFEKETKIVQLLSDDTKQKQQSNNLTVYGKVCAGNGIEALEDPIDEIGDPYYRIKEEKFALLVDGDSMNNIVANGMYAIIEKRPVVNNGEIAVILIDNEVGMLKRFYQLDDMVILRPDSSNLDHKPLTFIGEEINSLKVLGRYLGCVSPMENLL